MNEVLFPLRIMKVAGTVDVLVRLFLDQSHGLLEFPLSVLILVPQEFCFPSVLEVFRCVIKSRCRKVGKAHSDFDSRLEEPVSLLRALARQVHLLLDGSWLTLSFYSSVIHTIVLGHRLQTWENSLILTFLVSQILLRFD